MRKLCIFFAAIGLVGLAQADERVTIYEGLGLKLVQSVDAMSDKKSCALFVNKSRIYISVEGISRVSVWPDGDGVAFAPDGNHRLRIGKERPVDLVYIPRRNGLSATNATKVVRALATGEELRVRYVSFPEYENIDVSIYNPAFSYAWGIAMRQCGWPDIGVPTDLPEAKLSVVYASDKDGYVEVSVVGNQNLILTKHSAKMGGGCYIFNVGFEGGRWTHRSWDTNGREKILVKDRDGAVVFEESIPATPNSQGIGYLWAIGEVAVRTMWKVAPYGTVSNPGTRYSTKTESLYGFRELWSWGVNNCLLPQVQPIAE